MAKIYSYVVARDFGFAPNPFFGLCSLATCKPKIRAAAQIGDWVVGTGCSKNKRTGYLVYAMKVEMAITFDEYWSNQIYKQKKPNLRGSKKQAFGDNIYHHGGNSNWLQDDSHHCNEDGSSNPKNTATDTQADRVLLGKTFIYFGGAGPKIPSQFRNWDGHDVCGRRGHKNKFPDEMISELMQWIQSLGNPGYYGDPIDWNKSP